ncbi:hypothetical protein MNBD_NITROSPINAE02-1062 [hydrothermal vent metagenome]|uniref:Lipoprotein n=1 Tax=hydrothermal vent metagenome TaxID=652676 RepID=A0A3B1BK11_9ZZZZ
MRLIWLTIVIWVVACPKQGHAVAPELVTAPSEATVKVTGEDFAKARAEAIGVAFRHSAEMAVAGLASRMEVRMKKEIIQARIIERAEDFVKSYKFLEETVDQAKGYLKVRLQVTLFLDDIRREMRTAGIRSKKRILPKLIIIINEKNTGFFSGENVLILKSLSEEVLAQYFQDRGYQVVTRRGIMAEKLEKTALEALKLNKKAIARLSHEMEADLVILGKTKVEAHPSADGESIEAVVEVALFRGESGKTLWNYSDSASGVYEDVLNGSLTAIRSATSRVAKQLGLKTPRVWREIKEKTDE